MHTCSSLQNFSLSNVAEIHSRTIKVLVVDDERGARMALETPLRLSGYEVAAATGGREAIALGQRQRFDVVLTDIYMPDVTGLEVVRHFRRASPDTKIIAMTAQGSLEVALQAIEEGAFDFIAKPFDIDEVLNLVARAAHQHETTPATAPAPTQDFSASGLIGHSAQMVRAYKLTAHAARTGATILIEGESGTGKELIARAIHRHSPRHAHPFTAVNCSALTETLLESELFGYTKGSFTGATADRPGLFESTDGGTIFAQLYAATEQDATIAWLRPLPEFAAAARALGHAHVSPGVDGMVRSLQLSKADDRANKLWAFGLEAVRIAEGVQAED
jgi:DNA-binding NtrC family response regulator